MKLLIHDYAGHPFQVCLSSALAKRGHEVTHAYFADDIGPKGSFSSHAPCSGLSFRPVSIDLEYSKDRMISRRRGDIRYGEELARFVADEKYDVVVSGNTPLLAQEKLLKTISKTRTKFVFWCQDFYSIGVKTLLGDRYGSIGRAAAYWYELKERRQFSSSDHIVTISKAFDDVLIGWGIPSSSMTTIPNWGALDEIPVQSRDNDWVLKHGFGDARRYLYSGTLATKHNPRLLTKLADSCGSNEKVVVVASGSGAQKLKSRPADERMIVLPLQPFDVFSKVLGAGDVLVAMIEEDAGKFSVPSKILSYLCAGRPIVLAAPSTNLASRIVLESGAGTVVEPSDEEGFVAAARMYQKDPLLAEEAGRKGRKYAENNFDIGRVADRFEAIICDR